MANDVCGAEFRRQPFSALVKLACLGDAIIQTLVRELERDELILNRAQRSVMAREAVRGTPCHPRLAFLARETLMLGPWRGALRKA
jgi:hypothetical protein